MPRVLGMVFAAAAIMLSATARAENVLGVQLPAHSKRLSDGRYEVKSPYETVVAHFEKTLGRAKTRYASERRVHRASVKYTHFESLEASSAWEHINVAAFDGSVFVVFLVRQGSR